MKNIYVLTLVVLSLFGCASSKIKLHSEPREVEVFLVEANQAPKSLGSTPVNLESDDFNWGDSNSIQLRFQKEGYETENIILPKTKVTANFKINTFMQEEKKNLACQDQSQSLRKVADAIAKSQNYIYKKQMAKAKILLESLIIDYPNLSVLYDLLGNVYYLEKDLKSSLEAYKKSLSLWPNNLETKRMILRLENIMNVGFNSRIGG